MVYNAIKGTNGFTDFSGKFDEIEFPYLYVSSPEDYAEYQKYFVDQLPYTDDEMVALSNENFDALKKSAESLSIEDAAQRAGGSTGSVVTSAGSGATSAAS